MTRKKHESAHPGLSPQVRLLEIGRGVHAVLHSGVLRAGVDVDHRGFDEGVSELAP